MMVRILVIANSSMSQRGKLRHRVGAMCFKSHLQLVAATDDYLRTNSLYGTVLGI